MIQFVNKQYRGIVLRHSNNMAVLAEVGRYPLVVKAAKLLCKFKNRVVETDDGRLFKQAFLQCAALGLLARSNSTGITLECHLQVIGSPSGLIPIHSRHAMRSRLSIESGCQCGDNKAAKQLRAVILRWSKFLLPHRVL